MEDQLFIYPDYITKAFYTSTNTDEAREYLESFFKSDTVYTDGDIQELYQQHRELIKALTDPDLKNELLKTLDDEKAALEKPPFISDGSDRSRNDTLRILTKLKQTNPRQPDKEQAVRREYAYWSVVWTHRQLHKLQRELKELKQTDKAAAIKREIMYTLHRQIIHLATLKFWEEQQQKVKQEAKTLLKPHEKYMSDQDRVTPETVAEVTSQLGGDNTELFMEAFRKAVEPLKTSDFLLGMRQLETKFQLSMWEVKFLRDHGRVANKYDLKLMFLFGGYPYALKSKQVYQTQELRDRHTYVIGKSGSGKTTLLLNMIYQDLKAGNGIGVIAPEQEMITEQILPFIPEDRLDDVIYFNPADPHPVSFNPLYLAEGEDIDLKVDEVFTIFKRIVGDDSGHRMNEILMQSLSALTELPDTTLLDIPRLLDRENPHYRQQVSSQLENSYCANFWREVYPQYPKDAHLPIINRLGRFIGHKKIRNTLCQTGPSLNFRKVMDEGKIVLFNLSDGILGPQNSQLLGQMIVSQFQLAVASRANIPEQQRRRFYLYIDEFQTFTSTATDSYEQILSRARKYRLALILAHQQTGQIPTDLLRDIIGNVSTMVSFTVSHADATKFSKEFLTEQYDYKERKLFLEPTPPAEFIGLKVGQAYCRMAGEAFKIKTFPITEKGSPEMAERVIARQQNIKQRNVSAGRPAEEPAKESPQSKPATDDDIFSGDPGRVFWETKTDPSPGQ